MKALLLLALFGLCSCATYNKSGYDMSDTVDYSQVDVDVFLDVEDFVVDKKFNKLVKRR